MSTRIADVYRTLGGKAILRKPIKNEADMAAVVAGGLPGKALRALRAALNLTTKEFGKAVLIPERTLLAHQKRGTLPAAESDRVYRLAQLTAAAGRALGDPEKAARWLRKPNRSLGGQRPLDAARTTIGARLVEDALARITHGTIG